jgi:hypothetical protein
VAADGQGSVYFSDRQQNAVWKLPAAASAAGEAAMPAAGEAAMPTMGYSAFVNAASLLAHDAHFTSPLTPYSLGFGAAPDEMVRIRGACLGPFDAVVAAWDAGGKLPVTLAGVPVWFDGMPAPPISTQAGEIWAVAPYA